MAKITAAQYRAMNKAPRKHLEESLQIKVAKYLRLKHPGVIFHSDVASGIKLTKGQAGKNKAMQYSKGFPDMFIAKPNLHHNGLFLELKKDREGVWLKDGTLSNKQHIQQQKRIHDQLWANGYCAVFACGYSEAIRIIEDYFSSKEI